jgi:hypothetical protein
VLRDHEIFRQPVLIKPSLASTIPVPNDWKEFFDDESIEVFPLAADPNRRHQPGWCSYVYEHVQTPELEFCCGGVNGKTPKAGAVWHQGNLLHFGFEQSPAELNETGRNLLSNSIAYISRFTEDRPIIQTPSSFGPGRHRIFDRDALARLIDNRHRNLNEYLKFITSAGLYKELADKSREELARWFHENRPWISATENGTLALDEEARSFGVSPSDLQFFAAASRALSGDQRDLASRLLARYAPEGPGANGSRDDWTDWYHQNQLFIFFSDTGGYRWYIDPLAKSRKIPTAELRGSARASRPAVAGTN